MRKLVLILIAFIAVVTFLRAFDNYSRVGAGEINTIQYSSIGTVSIPVE